LALRRGFWKGKAKDTRKRAKNQKGQKDYNMEIKREKGKKSEKRLDERGFKS
jgi:hypothetical protein